MKYYATKKRVSSFIDYNSNKFENKESFIKEVIEVINDLLCYDGEINNPNQLRFYRAVLKRLSDES